MLKLNLLAMQTISELHHQYGLRTHDVPSPSNSAVLLAIVGLSVYDTNSLSICRRCNMTFARVVVSLLLRPLTVCRLAFFYRFGFPVPVRLFTFITKCFFGD